MSGDARSHNAVYKFMGFLGGIFNVTFLSLILLVPMHWARSAPSTPKPELGRIYPHNEHGSVTYFTAFETTSASILFGVSIVSAILLFLFGARYTVIVRRDGYLDKTIWKDGDAVPLVKRGYRWGIAITLIVIFLIGPPLLRQLIERGFVLTG